MRRITKCSKVVNIEVETAMLQKNYAKRVRGNFFYLFGKVMHIFTSCRCIFKSMKLKQCSKNNAEMENVFISWQVSQGRAPEQAGCKHSVKSAMLGYSMHITFDTVVSAFNKQSTAECRCFNGCW